MKAALATVVGLSVVSVFTLPDDVRAADDATLVDLADAMGALDAAISVCKGLEVANENDRADLEGIWNNNVKPGDLASGFRETSKALNELSVKTEQDDPAVKCNKLIDLATAKLNGLHHDLTVRFTADK